MADTTPPDPSSAIEADVRRVADAPRDLRLAFLDGPGELAAMMRAKD